MWRPSAALRLRRPRPPPNPPYSSTSMLARRSSAHCWCAVAAPVRPHLHPFNVHLEVREAEVAHFDDETGTPSQCSLLERHRTPQRRFKSEAASHVDVIEHERLEENVHAGADYTRNIAVRTIVQRCGVIVSVERVDAESRHRKGCRFPAPRRTGDDEHPGWHRNRKWRKIVPSGLARSATLLAREFS